MRVLIAGFQHETNTFARSKTGYDAFVHGGAFPALVRGADLLELVHVNVPVAGALAVAARENVSVAPTVWAGATPAAHVTVDAYERIVGEICSKAHTERFDGVYLDLHGAMVCEHYDDGEGELLQRLREQLGNDIPIAASLDLHANITARMLEFADILVAYRTYPHVDMFETGQRAMEFLVRMLRSGERPITTSRRIPFLIPINAMATDLEPALSIYGLLRELEKRQQLTLSFTPGFPSADFPECGPAVWGHGSDRDSVEAAVEHLAQAVISAGEQWKVDLLGPAEAVYRAAELAKSADRPIVIADSQDNPGGGGDSSTTGLLRALLDTGVNNAGIGLIVDPVAAATAHRAGVGSELDIALGGRSGVPGDAPLHARFRVEQLSDGRCVFAGPMLTGKVTDLGPSACLSIGGVKIAVTTFADQMLDRNLFRMVGIEPERMAILVLKSSVHFRADFAPIAEQILIAKAPGLLFADPADLPWQRLDPAISRTPVSPAP